jgi:probable phosphoglycerate mutase
MTPLALIRHAPTEWNEARRIQGRADIPLSPRGREKAAGWTVPAEFHHFDWVASPLSRARETAALLGLSVTHEASIVEMDWGAWEGFSSAELAEKYGDEFHNRAARGIDLRPHEGESPREVRTRVADWLKRVAAGGRPTGAVTHQGIIRATISLATGWDMINKPPYKMDWASVHLFNLTPDGGVEIAQLNISLEARDGETARDG